MNNSELELLNLVPTPLFVLEALDTQDVTYVFFNQAALDIAKFRPENYLGLNATHLYQGEYGEFAYQKHRECCQSAQPMTYELKLPLNGKLRTIRTRLMPILSDSGMVKNIIGASSEVTAEHELDALRKESRSIEQELHEFMYLAAHDLRSPMKKIHMFADLLREDFVDMGDGKLEIIDLLERVSVESMSMIQAVLQHAETVGIEESIEDMRLIDITDEILAIVDPARLHTYRIDDCQIYGDRMLIKTTLRNLIDNSIKHNAPQNISLDVFALNARQGYFTMTITDNGVGMYAPDKLFKQTNGDRSKSGFGLLAIRKLIKNAGGDISAQSPAEGTGLVVTVTLPGRVS